jgi:hypothetical protein
VLSSLQASSRLEDIIRMNFREMRWEREDWRHLAEDKTRRKVL